jgi:hypothetical protein
MVLAVFGVGVTHMSVWAAVEYVGDVKPLKKPPNWLRRPVSVCCGFGGRLVGLANHKQQISDPMTGQVRPLDVGTVTLSQVSWWGWGGWGGMGVLVGRRGVRRA